MGPVLHADLAEVSSTDIIYRGFGSNLDIPGSGDSVLRQCGTSFFARARHFLLAVFVLLFVRGSFAAVASATAPKQKGVSLEIAKALKITRGKQIKTGLVFLNGKYLPAPYVVERYGNALRINGIQVTRALIPWGRFLLTQEGATLVTEETAAEEQPANDHEPTPQPEPKVESAPKPSPKPTRAEVEAGNYLDSLFDDDETEDEYVIVEENETDFGTLLPPKKSKSRAKQTATKSAAASKSSSSIAKTTKTAKSAPPSKSTTRKRVQFNGEFQMNSACKQMVDRINRRRTNIDTTLRGGGFVCFGSNYSFVTGDAGACQRLLAKLPELLKDSNDEESFLANASSVGLNFLHVKVLRGFYKNRLDCFKLIQRRNEIKEATQFKKALNGAH